LVLQYKAVERAIFDQLTDVFHFHPSLSAFRKGFGCQTALLKIIEDWKKAYTLINKKCNWFYNTRHI
jgi:hypothetical protein